MPLYTLKAAAGAFGAGQHVEPDGWVAPRTGRQLSEGMFVAQVVGRSMEPRIPDGAWCLFRSPVTGSRQGRIVLFQHQSIEDPESGGSYTVKRYESEKEADGRGDWTHKVIRLLPENPDFEPIVLTGIDEGEVSVIAELVDVLR
ncbi:MAG: S24 family peptidase [Thermoleophilia bacterium]|nr:S24 family peptidase [Thermoleophilia bacterium]